jgi:hypothetical protein
MRRLVAVGKCFRGSRPTAACWRSTRSSRTPKSTKPELSIGKPSLVFNGTDAGVILLAGCDVGPTDDRFLVLDSENPPVIRVIDNWARELAHTDHR